MSSVKKAPRKRRTPTRNVVFHDIARFRSQLLDRLLRPHGLTMSQAWVLAHLFWEDGLTQAEIAKRMEVGAVTLGGLVDRLEARGVVERRDDPGDRRAKRVYLTDDAEALLRVMNQCTAEIDRAAFAGLSAEEIDAMNAGLSKVRENLLAGLTVNAAGSDADAA